MIESHAPGKLILCGEHVVVYGRPAIALPISALRARVALADGPVGSGINFEARDIGVLWALEDDPTNPLSQIVTSLLTHLGITRTPDIRLTISSDMPIASGMGSGAAVATALVRAVAARFGRALPPDEVSALVYASEKGYHGTPSGIDNTVIAYEQPIWFVRRPQADGQPPAGEAERGPDTTIEPIQIAAPLTLLIGDTGVRSATHMPVGTLRQRWQDEPERYEELFTAVGALVGQARAALAQGQAETLGGLLDQNHALLQQIGVSSPELDQLVAAAQAAGALGAKLSGAGWGGVMLALVTPASRAGVAAALAAAGATKVFETSIAPSASGPA